MRFADSDIRPNERVPLDQVRVGNTSDARWRDVPPEVKVINCAEARR